MVLIWWLRDEGNYVGFSMFRGVVFMSLWVDLGFINVWGVEEYKYNVDLDIVGLFFLNR